MKFKIVRSTFLEGLKSVQNIVAAKGSLTILQNVLLKTRDGILTMTTTDLDISVTCEVACETEVEGETTLPVKLLVSSISVVEEGTVSIETDGMDRATIVAGSAKYKIAGLPASDYPVLPSGEESFAYSISQTVFREMLKKTSYAASQDDTRRTLKGVLLSFKNSKLTVVAADGRRLALVEKELEFPGSEERDIILPAKAVQELQRSLTGDGDVKIHVQKSQICFDLGKQKIYSKQIDDAYPKYEQVIPQEYVHQITIERQAMINALGRASVMTMDEAHSTKLTFSSGKLSVSSTASDIGEARDEVEIKYAGPTIEIMFNPTYVMDPLKAIDDDEVTINLNDGHSPAVITCSIPFLYVIMPLRIS
jgi:DNA polymerase-3 subunit beta